jgi:inosose dehydratase
VTDTFPSTDPHGPARPRYRVGSAPDSWGVWFPHDSRQTPWTRFLDEISRAGYDWLELGPYGYLPTDPETLRRELDGRGLRLAGGTVGGALHRRAELAAIQAAMLDVARLSATLGAEHVVFLPAMYRDLSDGRPLEHAELSEDQWSALVEGADHLARVLREETGMRFAFHPHAESHVETDEQIRRFLARTDPGLVGLCLDTGHVAYTHGDAPRLLREHADRSWYVHLKAVDPGVLAQAEAGHLSFADAVRRDVMCEPGTGVPALDDVIAGLESLPDGTFVIVEQDQQPYLQGYEAVDALWLYLVNANVLGGGQPVLTGPTFIDASNVAKVAQYAEAGNR